MTEGLAVLRGPRITFDQHRAVLSLPGFALVWQPGVQKFSIAAYTNEHHRQVETFLAAHGWKREPGLRDPYGEYWEAPAGAVTSV